MATGREQAGRVHGHPIPLLAAVLGLGVLTGLAFNLALDPQIRAGAGILALPLLGLLVLRVTKSAPQPLTAAEASRSSFFDHAIEGIFRTTVDGRYFDANPALARIYGYDDPATLIEELIDIAGQLYVDPARRTAFQSILREHDAVVDFVSEIRRRDGSTIWISENARAVRNWTGQIVFYEGTVEDVTGKIAAQRAMQRALTQSEEASRAKSAFLAAMSHEFKTPLNAILGFSEILRDELMGPLGQPAYRGYARDIHASGTRLLTTINDILDVVRLQSSEITLTRKACSAEDLARRAIEVARQATGDARLVSLDPSCALPPLFVDAARLQQVLANLMSNAFKFTPEGGRIAVRMGLTPEGGAALAVADEGIGMAPETVALALEPFSQIDASLARRFEGTGLGLFIARALVELHGGRLTIDSAKGRGSTVTILLPPDAVAQSPNLSPVGCMAG